MNSGRRTAREQVEFHVQRRNAELQKQEHWNSIAKYFKTWDVKASKYAAWTSPQYFQHSQDTRIEAEKREKKKQALMDRKEKLRQLLDNENKMFEEEIKNQSRRGRLGWMPLEDLKTVNLEMKRRSEQSRKREAELLLYQRWKQEQPTLKDLERKQHLEFMKMSWMDQLKEREAAKEKLKAEEAVRAREEELKRKEEEKLEKIHQKRKEDEVKDLKQHIKEQMEIIKESVQRYKELERQEAEEVRIQNQIEELITQRKLMEQKQANKHLVGYWKRQYQLKLQKKAKEVEEDIVQDQKLLERLETEFTQRVEARSHARDVARRDMDEALRELQAQRQRELVRQREYEHMFYEEAKRAWETQEQKWAQERQARNSLMKEVLDTVKKQVEEKLRRNTTKRAEALEDRERLLKEMNALYEQCREHETELKYAREHYRTELDLQVREKTIDEAHKAHEEVEFERKHTEMEKEAEHKLAVEMEKLRVNKYKPLDFRRQRILW